MDKQKPLLSLRPHFDDVTAAVQAAAVTVLGAMFLPVLLGTIVYILLSLLGLGAFVAIGYLYGFFLIAAFLVLPPLFFELKKKAYARSGINFHDDYADFQFFRFYLVLRRGRVRYRDITHVAQQANLLQDARGLTTLLLYVPSMFDGRSRFAGLRFADLPQRQDPVAAVMDLIEKSAVQEARPSSLPPAAASA